MQAQGKAQTSGARPRRVGTQIANVVRLLAAACAGGVLVAAVALPAVGGAGYSAKSGVEALQIEAKELNEPPLPEKTVLLDSSGKQIAQFYFQNRESVPLTKIAPVMQQAIIAIEDFRFKQHGALDVEGTFRAFTRNLFGGGVVQGGSSITQQYVKLVIFNSAETKEEQAKAIETSYARKLNEIRYAMAIENKYTKDEILNRYLNISYFGASAYGIEAASKRFFGKHASELDLAEAATLAGAVQSPSATDPDRGKEYRAALLARRNVVLDRMAQLKAITAAQATEAKAEKLGYLGKKIPGGCEMSEFPYFCLYVQQEILTNKDFGKTEEARRNFLQRGGLTIRTTLNRDMQKAADKAIKNWVYTSDKQVAAQALVEPGTGAIRALAASRKFGDDKKKNEISYNLPADGVHGGGSGFQAGSTFKVFTLVTALDEGLKLNDGFNTGSAYAVPDNAHTPFRDCKGNRSGETHEVRNSSEGSGGFRTLTTGTWGSVNTFFMKLEEHVGLCKVVKMAQKLGIQRADGTKLREVPTFTLGVNEMDPVTVAGAYATIAARGKRCAPMVITEIVDRNGKATPYEPDCEQVLDEKVADAASHILSGVFTQGTMSGVGGIGRDAAGKTGTTDGYTAAWFAGYTPDLASAVSIGDPRGAFRYDLTGVTIGGRYYPYVYGSSIAGEIWKDTMLGALKKVEPTSFVNVDMSEFGGCSPSFCAPKPKPKPEEKGGDGRGGPDGGNDGGGGDGGGGDGGGDIVVPVNP
ncbi:transglycosylase domain-containing protein [Acrocarpospora macrocephala]|uniref:Carboxypeptidase n=1 Tax=Acrocarpospora macrocephala TaxID=150177 RepID=A0A5M3WJV7_9ACTN|nr:transglycosylase domain-containing protein [Acrocarpospora macrocephala]GES08302.1 carboxypeptidase [Acrocarpospora macrocephala]